MIKTISTALTAFAVVTFAGFSSQATAQDCSSCGSVSNFGFPAVTSPCGRGGCLGKGHGQGHSLGQGHGHGHRFQELKNQVNHQAAINAKAAARNDAWPLPFSCRDKIYYYDVWRPMLAAGSETQGVLDQNFFTSNHELNRIGIDRVAGVAQNGPSSERVVYVSRSADQAVDQARLSAVRSTIATYYSHRGIVDVRLSEKVAPTVAAVKVQALNASHEENRPPATIFEVEDVNEAVAVQ